MKSLMGGDAADDNNEQQAPILILDDQPIDFDADLEEVQDESTAAAAAYKMGLQTSNFNLSQKKTDAQKKQFGGTAMTKSLQNNNVSKTAKRGSSTSNTIKKSKPSGVEIALHSGSNTSDKDNNTNNEEKEETTLIINNKLANAAYRIPTATERDNLVKTVDVSVGKSITGVTFDDRYVVAGSMDGILRIWDCDSTGVNKF